MQKERKIISKIKEKNKLNIFSFSKHDTMESEGLGLFLDQKLNSLEA